MIRRIFFIQLAGHFCPGVSPSLCRLETLAGSNSHRSDISPTALANLRQSMGLPNVAVSLS